MKLRSIAFLALVLISYTVNSQNRIERVEPAFWWIGMKNQVLQLLVYGDNIGDLDVSIDYKGVKLDSMKTTENSNYLFLYLSIGKECSPGKFKIIFLEQTKKVAAVKYELKQRITNSAQRTGFNCSDVIYLITPDRFANGDLRNDEIDGLDEKLNRSFEGGRHGGDLKGIINHLDYIDEMGFTSLWINPLLENAMDRYSYHGYSTTDFYKIDKRFGSNEEYLELSRLAADRGIKLIMDMIMNHCGSEHWFVKDPPSKDWINYEGEYVNTNHRRQTVQDLYASEYDKRNFADGWFVRSMPDMNQNIKLMADYLIQNSIWWIEYANLGGIRMDTYPYPDKEFMSRWSCEIMEEYPNFNIVGEEWSKNPVIVSYWQSGHLNHDGYVSCLPALMDFPIQGAMIEGLMGKEYFEGGLAIMYKTLALDFLYADPGNLVIFPDNHDMDRFYTQIGMDMNLYKMGLAYIFTMRGIPQIFYGTEILMHNTGSEENHGIIRTDFPGGWPGDTVNAFTGNGLSETQKNAQDYLKLLLNWRKDKDLVHSGKVMQFTPDNGTYVYFRYNDKEKIMVILNKNQNSTELDLSRFDEMLNIHSYGVDVASEIRYDFKQFIQVPGRTTLILELH